MERKTFESFNKIIKKRNFIRWASVIVYLIIIAIFSIIPLLLPFVFKPISTFYIFFISGFSIISMFLLLLILTFPYGNKVYIPESTSHHTLKQNLDNILDSNFYEEVKIPHVRIIIWFVLFFVGIVTFVLILFLGFMVSLVHAIVVSFVNALITALLIIGLIVFGKITIILNPEQMIVSFGPFKDKIIYNDIKSIQSTAIRPLKDFMGLGRRVGSDGSLGYIAGKVGIRIELINKNIFVISTKEPQYIINFISKHKSLA